MVFVDRSIENHRTIYLTKISEVEGGGWIHMTFVFRWWSTSFIYHATHEKLNILSLHHFCRPRRYLKGDFWHPRYLSSNIAPSIATNKRTNESSRDHSSIFFGAVRQINDNQQAFYFDVDVYCVDAHFFCSWIFEVTNVVNNFNQILILRYFSFELFGSLL